MSLADLLVRTVTIQTAVATVDRYGDETNDWSVPIERSASAWIAQTVATEDLTHRDATVSTLAITLEVSAALTAEERVVVDGVPYEVVGEPNVAWTPRGPHHTEALLRAVIG